MLSSPTCLEYLLSGQYCATADEASIQSGIDTIKPIQLSSFDFDGYLAARRQFTTEEWIDLLIQEASASTPSSLAAQQTHAVGADPVL